MEEMLKAILTEVQGVNKRLGSLENRFDSFEVKFEEKIDNLASEMRSNFRYLENKIDEHTKLLRKG